ncbi:hypothetical protein VTN00DRAFT_5422 [Thermoascus crustaceus]|uniref:uncharacterized protein n=1 Tax=Thermoascus crustaceus TaxID=5088 RepID=UPI003742E91A
MGPVKAAQCATTVSQQFPNVRFALMVGIGAGIPSLPRRDIRLGDIAVSIPQDNHPGVVQYDFGKYEQDGFVLKGSLNKPPSVLVSADGSLEEDEIMNRSLLRKILRDITKRPGFSQPNADDILYDQSFHHVNKGSDCSGCEQSDEKKLVSRALRPQKQPVVHQGLILSGSGVIKNPQDRDRLRRDYNDAICFEMEAAGIMDEIPCLVVQGICDYADTHKQDGWHHFAAAVAAAYCKAVLRKVDRQDVEETSSMSFLMKAILDNQSIIQGGVDAIDQKIDLARLPVAEGASFNSYTNQHEDACLPGTRTKLLHDIEDWVNDAHDWPGDDSIQALVTMAIPLFIFAATLCRFVGDMKWNPEKRLAVILKDQAVSQASKMDRTYLPILNQLLTGQDENESEQLVQEFQEIVGVIYSSCKSTLSCCPRTAS